MANKFLIESSLTVLYLKGDESTCLFLQTSHNPSIPVVPHGGDPPLFHGLTHSTAGLVQVRAVSELAAFHQGPHLGKIVD